MHVACEPFRIVRTDSFCRHGGFPSSTCIIENTAGITNPVKLSNGNGYVNASEGVRDFEIILDLAATRLGTTVAFVERLKQRTILRPEIDFD